MREKRRNLKAAAKELAAAEAYFGVTAAKAEFEPVDLESVAGRVMVACWRAVKRSGGHTGHADVIGE